MNISRIFNRDYSSCSWDIVTFTSENTIKYEVCIHNPIITEGSKQSNHTATAVVVKSQIKLLTYQTTSQFSFHLHCWTWPICHTSSSKWTQQTTTQTLDLSAFFLTFYLASTPLVTRNFDHPITLQIVLKYHNFFSHSFNIIFCWLLSHVGIPGNEKADKTKNQDKIKLI